MRRIFREELLRLNSQPSFQNLGNIILDINYRSYLSKRNDEVLIKSQGAEEYPT